MFKKALPNVGLADVLILLRRAIVSFFCWYICSKLLKMFNFGFALIIMFLISVVIVIIFLLLSDHFKGDWFGIEDFKKKKAEKQEIVRGKKFSLLIWVIKQKWFHKNGRNHRVLVFLFLVEPFVFLLYYRDGNNLYNGFSNRKTSLLFLLSSLMATLIWAGFLTLKNYVVSFI